MVFFNVILGQVTFSPQGLIFNTVVYCFKEQAVNNTLKFTPGHSNSSIVNYKINKVSSANSCTLCKVFKMNTILLTLFLNSICFESCISNELKRSTESSINVERIIFGIAFSAYFETCVFKA